MGIASPSYAPTGGIVSPHQIVRFRLFGSSPDEIGRLERIRKAQAMEILFILFLLIATSVLGLLCLLVLEYQNGRVRRWMHFQSERYPLYPPHPTPISPGKKAIPAASLSSQSPMRKSP